LLDRARGNYLLWGFNAPADEMTNAGKQLFANLLVDHEVGAIPIVLQEASRVW
jgi:hypothetical protein